jgi:hypothetical protein
MPGMVDPRRERQSYFADNLRPQMQGLGGVLPFFVWQWRPEFFPLRWRQPSAHARSQKLNASSRKLSRLMRVPESVIACLL